MRIFLTFASASAATYAAARRRPSTRRTRHEVRVLAHRAVRDEVERVARSLPVSKHWLPGLDLRSEGTDRVRDWRSVPAG